MSQQQKGSGHGEEAHYSNKLETNNTWPASQWVMLRAPLHHNNFHNNLHSDYHNNFHNNLHSNYHNNFHNNLHKNLHSRAPTTT